MDLSLNRFNRRLLFFSCLELNYSKTLKFGFFFSFLFLFFFCVFFHANDNEQQRNKRFIVRAYRVNDELPNEQQPQLRLSKHKHLQRQSSDMNDISIFQHTNVSYCLYHRMNRCISNVELLPFSSPSYVKMHRN